MSVRNRLAHAFNAFLGQDPYLPTSPGEYGGYSSSPSRRRFTTSNERSIVAAIYVRMAIDCASVDIRHVYLDKLKRYSRDASSGLNECLNVEANIDQGGRDFRQDIFATMFDKGYLAIVPVDQTINPNNPGNWDILTMRVGEILEFFPQHVKVRLYNDKTGRHEDLTLEKGKQCAVVYNPFYAVMNEPNSTLQRLIRKLNILDAIDEQSGSGKLDIIIQLPYQVKSESMRIRAGQRRTDIEDQLIGSKYGIAYVDSTEKVTQLNRPAENNLLAQIEYLMGLLHNQLGVTKGVMDGTAEEAEMLNYNYRTIEPSVGAVAEAMIRSFLTKTARSQGQTVLYFRDPFKLVPMKDLAEMADKFTRNEIVTSNEFRQFLGLPPSSDPKADELRNSNMPQSELGAPAPGAGEIVEGEVVSDTADPLAEIEAAVESVIGRLEEGL